MRRLVLVLVLVLEPLAGCSTSEPEEEPTYARAKVLQPRQQRVEVRGETRSSPGPAPTVGLAPAAEPRRASPARIKQELLAKYGRQLTSLQRSAIQTARFTEYAQGEKMCLDFIEENRRFEEPR